MNYFKKSAIFMICLLLLSFSCMRTTKTVFIENGKSDYVIVLSESASPSERYAADELRKTVEKMSGCTLPIVLAAKAPLTKRIFIGQSFLTDQLIDDVDEKALEDEEFFIRTIGGDLFIIGGQKRGTMYGVFTFLEKYFDCRWYTADVVKIPKKKTLFVYAINDQQKPAFEYRMTFFTEAFDRTWATHNKINGYGADLPSNVGGKVKYAKGHLGHTFYALVPPEKYFKTHPEYFSLVNGKRASERGQICLTNPDVLKVAIKEIEEWIKQDPDANIVSITQNDWEGWCECENCKALDEKEKSHSGTVVAFVNAIAEAFADKYPDKLFDTFAYTYTQKPPKNLTVRDNVIIRLCHMQPSCDAHALTECERNADYVDHLRGWSEKGGKMYVWHYVTDFSHYLLPFPNFNAIRKDIPFYYKEGVDGLFCQGATPENGGAENAELRSYVLAKMLWDPSVNVVEIINDFLQGVYGKAAGPIRDYFNMMHKITEKPGIHFNLFSNPDDGGYLTPDVIKKAHEYFYKAEKRAENIPETLARVQKAHLPVYYADLWFQRQNQIHSQEPVDQDMLATFKELVAKNGIINQSERSKMTSFLQTLSSDCRFVRDLKIIGPFDAPKAILLKTEQPPESEIDFNKEYRGVAGVKVAWRDWTKKDGLYVDFIKAFDPDSVGIAYGLCYIQSPEEFLTQLGIGSNDGVRVYLNDKLVHENIVLRKATPNTDMVNVTLKKGWNKVLVKVDQIGGGWGLYLSVIDPEQKLLFGTKELE
jgi:hypothetical protein